MQNRTGPWSIRLVIFVPALFGAAGLSAPLLPGQEPEKAKAPELPAGQAAPPVAAPPVSAASLPPGVIARVNGRDISVSEYVGYLFASLGKSRLDELIDRLLVEEEAKRLAISVQADQVEAGLKEHIDRTVKALYQGSMDAFSESLAKRRTNLEEYQEKKRQELYYDMLVSEIIVKARQVTEADLLKQFEKAYGEGGVQYTLRHILIASRNPAGPGPAAAGASPGGDSSGVQRTPAEARERAERIQKELQAGADFVQAVKQYSDDAFTKRNEGRIPHYRKGFYGENFHAAVLKLTPESPLSGVVESPRGYHLIQLVTRQVTKFEDVKAEIEKVVKDQPPSAKERHDLIQALRSKAKIEGL